MGEIEHSQESQDDIQARRQNEKHHREGQAIDDVGLFGMFIELIFLRPLYKRHHVYTIPLT
ncbi:MAG: hypothetical protein KKA46_03865, partial [Proteobacteria bacterium]|nr:hypothetical protein [Pseudomonadota bacterium]